MICVTRDVFQLSWRPPGVEGVALEFEAAIDAFHLALMLILLMMLLLLLLMLLMLLLAGFNRSMSSVKDPCKDPYWDSYVGCFGILQDSLR